MTKLANWASFLGLVAFLLSVAFPARADPERLSVAYCVDCVPFHYQDQDGEPAGLIIDYWRLWSKKTGVEIDFIAAPWDETLKMVGTGAIDAHAGLFFNSERDKFLDYGSALRKTDTHVFFHRSIPTATEFRQLSAYRIGVISGDYVEGFLKERIPLGHIASYPDYDAIIEALKVGELKVFAADTPTGLYHLKQAGLLAEFTFVPDGPLYRSDWFTAAQEGDTATIELINKGMARITAAEKLEIGRRWIDDTRDAAKDDALIVAIDRGYPPFTFINAQGQPAGMFVDLWQLWSEKSGRKIRFRPSNWSETLEGLRSGEVDVHSGLSYSDARAEWIGFSGQIYQTASRLYHRIGEEVPADLRAYDGYVLGIWAGTFQEAEVRRKFPRIVPKSYRTTTDLLNALVKGEIDAALQEDLVMDDILRERGLQSRIVARPERLLISTIHGGVAKDKSKLLADLDEGLKLISPSEMAKIEARWLPIPERRFFGKGMFDAEIGLTRAERAWLNAHPILRLGSDRAWPPYEFVDDEGVHRGLSAAFIKRVERILGIAFQPPRSLEWSETIAAAKAQKLDILTSIAPTPEREAILVFTEPYMIWPNVIATREDISDIGGLEDLAGRPVGVVEGYAIHEVLERDSPDLDIVSFKDIPAGLEALRDGLIVAFIDSPVTIDHFRNKLKIDNLALVAETPYNLRIALGIRKDWPELAVILDKALAKIPPEERKRLAVSVGVPSDLSVTRLTKQSSGLLTAEEAAVIIAVVVAVIGLIVAFAWLIRTQKKPFFQSLRGKSIVFVGGVFLLVGGATLWAFGFVGERVSAQLGRYIAERHVLWHKEKVLGAVQRELALSKQMAESELLIQWAANESNPEVAARARDELQRYHDNFRAQTYFVGLAPSRHFFYADEKVSNVSLDVIDTLSREDEDDIWFFATIEDKAPYNLNVDHNVQLGVTNLWVNYAMRRDGETYGVVGTGIHLTNFVNDFITQNVRGVEAMMIDDNGAIQAHVDKSKIAHNVLGHDAKDSGGFWNLLASDEDRLRIRSVMAKQKNGGSEAEALFINLDGKRSLVAMAYLAPLNWYTLSLFDPSSLVGLEEIGTLVVVLGVSLLITVVVVIIGQNMLIIRPLDQLAQGARRLSGGDYDVNLTIDQRDEIGDLTKTFNSMASTIADYTRTLEEKVEQRTRELQNSEQQANAILNTAFQLQGLLERDGTLIQVNAAALSMIGASKEDVQGLPFWDCPWWTHSSLLQGKLRDAVQQAAKGETAQFLATHETDEGAARYIDFRITPVRNDNGEVVLLVPEGHDITDLKEAEAKLRDAYQVITDSINYASRIQRSVLPDEALLQNIFEDYFIFWEPRDVVGGDVYWASKWGRGIVLVLGDCTGHGVPGAFMTLITTGAMERALMDVDEGRVGVFLQRIHQTVQSLLGQDRDQGESDDGMDLGVCYFGPELKMMHFASARFDLFVVEDGEISIAKPTKNGIGYRGLPFDQEFGEQRIELRRGQSFYLTSDGLIDQVGGGKRRSFGKKRFKELLGGIQSKPMAEQKVAIQNALSEYQGDQHRRDDVSVIGFRV